MGDDADELQPINASVDRRTVFNEEPLRRFDSPSGAASRDGSRDDATAPYPRRVRPAAKLTAATNGIVSTPETTLERAGLRRRAAAVVNAPLRWLELETGEVDRGSHQHVRDEHEPESSLSGCEPLGQVGAVRGRDAALLGVGRGVER